MEDAGGTSTAVGRRLEGVGLSFYCRAGNGPRGDFEDLQDARNPFAELNVTEPTRKKPGLTREAPVVSRVPRSHPKSPLLERGAHPCGDR